MRTVTSIFGLFTLLGFVSGCDFWAEKRSRHDSYCDQTGCYACDWSGCTPTGGGPGGACEDSNQCAEGCSCDRRGKRCVETGTCDRDRDCAQGYVCDVTRRSCEPTATDGGVQGISDSGTTVPDGGVLDVDAGKPQGSACGADCDCSGSQICQNGACADRPPNPNTGCTYNNECGSGQCKNNRCQAACAGNGDCGTGDICSNGFCEANPKPVGGCIYDVDCGPGTTCINGACHTECQSSQDCKNAHDFCDSGVCKPDWRRVPQCNDNSGCAGSEECVNAVCRTHCWINADCGGCVNQPVCQVGYCVAQTEVNPQCKGQGDCQNGQSCVNASCQ